MLRKKGISAMYNKIGKHIQPLLGIKIQATILQQALRLFHVLPQQYFPVVPWLFYLL